MNGDKYKPVIEQYERSESMEDRIECLFTMTKMIATNHLHDIEKNQQKLWKATIGIGVVILLAILFSDQVSLTKIVEFIARVL